MKYVKWTLIVLFWTLVAGFLHYTLPQHDVVRITDTYETRVNPGRTVGSGLRPIRATTRWPRAMCSLSRLGAPTI